MAQGWVLEQSIDLMGMVISAESTGLFVVSRLLFVPSLVMLVLGAICMKLPNYANRAMAVACLLSSVFALGAWYFQKSTIDAMSIVGIGPALGLFLLLVSGLGGLLGSILMLLFPPKPEPRTPS